MRQIIDVEAGKTYRFTATLNNAPGISGQPYIDNYQAGGCWCNQGLWWSEPLQDGQQQIETYFTTSVTGSVVFQFAWKNAQGETRLDDVAVIDTSGGGDSNPPMASFAADPQAGTVPFSVSFTDQSTAGSNPITSWAWDVNNDGITDYTTQNLEHEYTSPGTYTVSLTVSDGSLTDTETKADYITVSDPGDVVNLLHNGDAELDEALDQISQNQWAANDVTPPDYIENSTVSPIGGLRSFRFDKTTASNTTLSQRVYLAANVQYTVEFDLRCESNISGDMYSDCYNTTANPWDRVDSYGFWTGFSPGNYHHAISFTTELEGWHNFQFVTYATGELRLDNFTLSGPANDYPDDPTNLLVNGQANDSTDLSQGPIGFWEADPLSGADYISYTGNALYGSHSLQIYKTTVQSASNEVWLRQAVPVEAGKTYVLYALLNNSGNISGNGQVTNFEWGGSWGWQNLWWDQPLTPGRQLVSASFTPNITGNVAILFQWGSVTGITRLDSLIVKDQSLTQIYHFRTKFS